MIDSYLLQRNGEGEPPTFFGSLDDLLGDIPPWFAHWRTKNNHGSFRPWCLTLFNPPNYIQKQFRWQVCPLPLLNRFKRGYIRGNMWSGTVAPMLSFRPSPWYVPNSIFHLPQFSYNAFEWHFNWSCQSKFLQYLKRTIN